MNKKWKENKIKSELNFFLLCFPKRCRKEKVTLEFLTTFRNTTPKEKKIETI